MEIKFQQNLFRIFHRGKRMSGDFPREEISDSENVSRLLWRPFMLATNNMELSWPNVFVFQTSNNNRESLVWRKYKPSIDSVHDIGLAMQDVRESTGRNHKYLGFATSEVGRVRGYSGANNTHQLEVTHEPEDGQGQEHSEVGIVTVDDSEIRKQDKIDIRSYLKRIFSPNSDLY